MHLLVGGKTLSVGQLGPDFLLLDSPCDYPPALARLFSSVDGAEVEREIFLPSGISEKTPRVNIALPQ